MHIAQGAIDYDFDFDYDYDHDFDAINFASLSFSSTEKSLHFV